MYFFYGVNLWFFELHRYDDYDLSQYENKAFDVFYNLFQEFTNNLQTIEHNL